MTTYTEEGCPYKDNCPYDHHEHPPTEDTPNTIQASVTFSRRDLLKAFLLGRLTVCMNAGNNLEYRYRYGK